MYISLNRISAVFLFLMCLFPYVSIFKTPFDTQPYALFFSCIMIFLFFTFKKDIALPKLLIPFAIVMAYAFVLLLFSSDMLNGFRSLIGYVSVFTIALAGYLTFHHVRGKSLVFAVVIWFLFGCVQLVLGKGFGSFMLSRISTTELRGVTSLAVEPSMYAVLCIFFLVLNDIFYARNDYSKKVYYFIFLLSIIQILLLSRASLGLMMLVVYLVSKVFAKRNSFKKTLSFFGLVVGGYVFLFIIQTLPFLQQGRTGQLVNRFLSDPMAFVFSDASVSDRLSHVLVSHISLIHSYGLGFGLGSWGEYAPGVAANSGEFILNLTGVWFTLGRVMSGWGTAIFELGIVGLFFIWAYIYVMHSCINKVGFELKGFYRSSFLTVFFVMLMSVSIAFPLFGYLIGALINIQMKQVVIENHNLKLDEQ